VPDKPGTPPVTPPNPPPGTPPQLPPPVAPPGGVTPVVEDTGLAPIRRVKKGTKANAAQPAKGGPR